MSVTKIPIMDFYHCVLSSIVIDALLCGWATRRMGVDEVEWEGTTCLLPPAYASLRGP